VIDPGVGSDRKAVIIKTDQNIYIGPDNGLFSLIFEDGSRVYSLTKQEYFLPNPSNTFHGRDIFAPAAAHAALGELPSSFGPEISDLIFLPDPLLDVHPPETIQGQVLHPDRFGNLLTSLGRFEYNDTANIDFVPWLPIRNRHAMKITINPSKLRIELSDGGKLPFVNNFSEVPKGTCGALIGSSRLIEIVANQDDASRMLNLFGGELVKIRISKV
jgi:S-adenosylmethionine hydrolase